ncbi:MAG TPA: VOC family protein [Mobilitalea sp.]|nr:VOC family protein [Mobilitalea sp.]
MENLDSNIIWQIAVVVRNIQKAAKNYAKLFGMEIPEILVSGLDEKESVIYKGSPSNAIHKLTFFKMGLIQLELIEPNNEPSTWRNFLEQKGEGVHHIAVFVKSEEEALEYLGEKGIKPLQRGIFELGTYNYMDTEKQLGVILSLSEKYKNMR